MQNKIEALEQIKNEVLDLRGSSLVDYRIENGYIPVLGSGSENAQIFFIGEAPGQNEAKTGEPFIGRSGKFLDELLQSIGLKREEVFITSVVKDRPPKNRDPKPEEIAFYTPFLDRQIDIIKPKIIATLGRFAMDYIMRKYGLDKEIQPISELHGQKFKVKTEWGDMSIVVLYHPSVSIYTQKLKPILFEDFKILKHLLT